MAVQVAEKAISYKLTLPIRLSPLLAGFLAAAVALIVAVMLGRVLPFDIAAVFLAIGLAATWIARESPWRGAVFVSVLSAVVLAVVYGG